MAKLRDWLFGLGPEESLKIFHEYAMDEYELGRDANEKAHEKYWKVVSDAVLTALNEIRTKDGQAPVETVGGRIVKADPAA
jgi:hypothetical protein